MRLFVAIDIPEDIKKEIRSIQNKLPNFLGKKTEIKNLHLTLKFLGEISEDKLKDIKERLRKIKFNQFEAEIDKVGVFYPDSIRIIWLHMKNCEKLQKTIDESLSGLFAKEQRFMSHLTIARVKNVKNKTIFLKELKRVKFNKVSFMVKNFKLKNSILTNKGSFYEDLEVYNLE